MNQIKIKGKAPKEIFKPCGKRVSIKNNISKRNKEVGKKINLMSFRILECMYFSDEDSENFRTLYLGNPNRSAITRKCLTVKRKKTIPETSNGRDISRNIFLTKFNPGKLTIKILRGSKKFVSLIPNNTLDIFFIIFKS
mgnify:CR=1 FL=1